MKFEKETDKYIKRFVEPSLHEPKYWAIFILVVVAIGAGFVSYARQPWDGPGPIVISRHNKAPDTEKCENFTFKACPVGCVSKNNSCVNPK